MPALPVRDLHSAQVAEFCTTHLCHVLSWAMSTIVTGTEVIILSWLARDILRFCMESSESWETPSVLGKLRQLVALPECLLKSWCPNQPIHQLHQAAQVISSTAGKVHWHVRAALFVRSWRSPFFIRLPPSSWPNFSPGFFRPLFLSSSKNSFPSGGHWASRAGKRGPSTTQCSRPGSSVSPHVRWWEQPGPWWRPPPRWWWPAFSDWQPWWPGVCLKGPSLFPIYFNVQPSTINGCLRTVLLNLNVHKNHLGILVKCRFQFSRPGVEPNFLTSISNKLPGDASIAGVGTTLWVEGSGMQKQ